jgi:hypothetical protein
VGKCETARTSREFRGVQWSSFDSPLSNI